MHMRTESPWLWLPVAALATPAYAASYLTVEQAQRQMFPGATLTPVPLRLDSAQRAVVERATGQPVPHADFPVWRASSGGYFFLDAVIGKHELITYALGVNRDGTIADVEILDYRESYGGEIRNPGWRRQFVHKSAADPLTLDQDIRNISGATLSSRHVTDGIRRLMAIHALLPR